MTLQTISVSLTLVLLLYIAYTQYKTYLVAQATLATFVGFLEVFVEEGEDSGETHQFH